MKEGLEDKVFDELTKRHRKVIDHLKSQSKGIKPFRKQPMTPMEKVYAFDKLTPEDMTYGVQTYGLPWWVKFSKEIHDLRMKLKE